MITKAGCREQDTGFTLTRRVQSSSSSDSSGGIGARETYSRQNVPIAVIDVTSPTTCQRDFTAERNKCARTGCLKYFFMHRKGVRHEAQVCLIVE